MEWVSHRECQTLLYAARAPLVVRQGASHATSRRCTPIRRACVAVLVSGSTGLAIVGAGK